MEVGLGRVGGRHCRVWEEQREGEPMGGLPQGGGGDWIWLCQILIAGLVSLLQAAWSWIVLMQLPIAPLGLLGLTME